MTARTAKTAGLNGPRTRPRGTRRVDEANRIQRIGVHEGRESCTTEKSHKFLGEKDGANVISERGGRTKRISNTSRCENNEETNDSRNAGPMVINLALPTRSEEKCLLLDLGLNHPRSQRQRRFLFVRKLGSFHQSACLTSLLKIPIARVFQDIAW